MTLAPKLPYNHAFAGGYPRVAGQSVPTDPDCLDYLARLSAADGAGVEVGVAMAIQSFIQGCKADSAGYAGDPTRSNWDAIQAACIMCGARTIAGATVPLKGTAPTPQGSWASGDYSRGGSTPGLKGNGVDKYIDTNRAGNADGQDDNHLCTYETQADSSVASTYSHIGSRTASPESISALRFAGGTLFAYSNNVSAIALASSAGLLGMYGTSRSGTSLSVIQGGSVTTASRPTTGQNGESLYAFARNDGGSLVEQYDGRLAFYSIGSACDLSLLDARVTALVRGIQFAQYTGLSPADFDDATVAYIVAGYIAGGAL